MKLALLNWISRPLFLLILTSTPVLVSAQGSYAINPGDTLDIFIWNEDELNRQVLVRPDGFISFPMIGDLQVGGLTPGQVQTSLSDELGEFLQDKPVVTVSMLGIEGNQVFVIGKVNRPGPYTINSPTDVMQALALAGGLSTFAAENQIRILRRDAAGTQTAIRFKYSNVENGEDLDANILLQSGDVVVVP